MHTCLITTIHEIVCDTCEAIWEFLRDARCHKSEKEWLYTAHEFYDRTNFPNYLGAVDSKHVRLCKPDDSRSLFFNYKNFFSTVLMALVDENYCFMSIDVGAYGASSDCNSFKNSNFCKKLEGNNLNFPGSRQLPNDDNGTPMPFVIEGDESFALSQHILQPYSNRNLDISRHIFNYSLTHARRVVQCAFGIPCNKWRIFHRANDVCPDFCDVTVKSCSILRNIV